MNYFMCKFCNRPCRPCYEDPKSASRSMYDKHWRCDYHGIAVKHIGVPPDELTSLVLSVNYKDYQYDCMFNYDITTPSGGLIATYPFRILKMNRAPKTVEVVVSLDFHPDITPENVVQKLPTLILFS